MTQVSESKMDATETFKAVVGYEGFYEVSDLGRVKSLRRTVGGNGSGKGSGIRVMPERILTPQVNCHGYLHVVLCMNGARRTRGVQYLVAEAFIGPRPPGMELCHNDGCKTNNALKNLRYDTPEGNQADKLLHDTHIRGERNKSSKLTEVQVLSIRADTRPLRLIANEYGVTESCACAIRLRKSWAWLN